MPAEMTTQMGGRHDADFSFNQLCSLLVEVGYAMHKAKGSHVIFQHGASFLNLQSTPGGKAKAYQVRLIRRELPNLGLKP
jgi:predicted RNA binding protein YcfA (HicA-like mRNA interferase family)